MAKKTAKKAAKFQQSISEALSNFDLKAFNNWIKKYNPPLWNNLKNHSEEVQMATMCKFICNRTDMLNTEAHKKALAWLKEHNMRGRIF